MAYNMKRGNSAVPFKELGSSPIEYHAEGHTPGKKEIGPQDSIEKKKEGKIDRLRMDYKSGKISLEEFNTAKEEIGTYGDY